MASKAASARSAGAPAPLRPEPGHAASTLDIYVRLRATSPQGPGLIKA